MLLSLFYVLLFLKCVDYTMYVLVTSHARVSLTDQLRIGLAIFRSGNDLCYSFVTKLLFIKSFYISTVDRSVGKCCHG